MTPASPRFAHLDGETTELTNRLIALASRGLPKMYRAESNEFAFTRVFTTSGDRVTARLSGASLRYAAITALGARFLPEDRQPALLGGRTAQEFTGLLVERLPAVGQNLGDAALIAWAAAETGHPKLPTPAVRRLRESTGGPPEYVVEAAWVVSRSPRRGRGIDVEEYLAQARQPAARRCTPGGPVFPHATGPGLVKPYRGHIACFADQVYPLQALARLHRSRRRPGRAGRGRRACAAQHLRAAGRRRTVVVALRRPHRRRRRGLPGLQRAPARDGPDGAARPGRGGRRRLRRADPPGTALDDGPPELGAGRGEPMILDDAGVTWRKVYRGDPKKAVRGRTR